MYKVLYHTYDNQKFNIEKIKNRCPFTHDLNKVLESNHFKLLSQKTQLIPNTQQFHNRLKHSIDVSIISNKIVNHINSILNTFDTELINKELVKVASLTHDIGHPPFGHSGERVLDKLMAQMGGFESNAQTIKILVNNPFNTTYRILVSLLKHKQVIPEFRNEYTGLIKGYYGYMTTTLEPLFLIYQEDVLEQYIIDIADTISYNISDLKDLVLFFGRNKFTHLVDTYFTRSEIYEKISSTFTELSKNELNSLIPTIIDDIKENTLGALLKNKIEKHSVVTHPLIDKLINNIELEINHKKPMYSKLKLPLQDQMKLFLLNYITKKCYLERDFNKLIDTNVTDKLERTFDYFFHLNDDELPFFHLEKNSIQKLISTSNETEKARYICDIMCQFSDNQILNLTNKLDSRTIVNY